MRGTFVVAGGGEARDGGASYRDSIVRLGDVSLDGLRDKVRYVVERMEGRLAAPRLRLGRCDLHPGVHGARHRLRSSATMLSRGAAREGLTWHYCRPPVVDIEFEMDVRATAAEIVI